ncbi:MAG: GNAT family N-acetyltransferase [Reichenbachiella sp.]|uniref:GNAT family N-acetyltransferase n=1 Tax=Reichenbachiella sp. TaxID=2184521 RepID=UPI0032981C72
MNEKTNYLVRPVKLADMNQLIQLCADHASYEDAGYSKGGKAKELSEYLFSNDSPVKCLVVSDEKNLMGYTTFMKQFSTWDARHYIYMDCLYLSPDARNQGLGKKLIECIVEYAHNERCTEIQWQTPTSNTRAIKFYKQNGADSKSKVRFFLQV